MRALLDAVDDLLARGLVPRAYDLLESIRGRAGAGAPILRRKALALARLGRVRQAQSLLSGLYARGDRSPETLGILARTHKDLWKASPPGRRRLRHLRTSRDIYRESFRAHPRDGYTGVNAATLSLLLGEAEEARRLAAAVVARCGRGRRLPGAADYWREATLGEAHLVLGDLKTAAVHYRSAARAGRRALAHRATTAAQARLILERLRAPGAVETAALAAVERELGFGAVVHCVGHMIDAPGRATPRFPAAREGEVRRRIRQALAELDATVGYCAAACGTDILFGEEMLRRRGEVHVHLPFRRRDFLETSVRHAGERWVRRFHRLLGRATTVSEPVGEAYLGDDCLFGSGNEAAYGRACLRADALGVRPVFLAVWDRRRGSGRYGTAGMVGFVRRHGGAARRVIDVGDLGAPRGPGRPGAAGKAAARGRPARLGRGIRGVLFADVAGFTRLDEEQRPEFMFGFMGAVRELFTRGGFRPLSRNTWGDALYCVFRDVLETARFALAFRDMVRDADWSEMGLPRSMTVRIALHAGPLFGARDPVTGVMTYYGAHAVRAARIEPVTLAGSVFVSETFAALLRARCPKELSVEYVGLQELPKGYGQHPIYLLRRAGLVE